LSHSPIKEVAQALLPVLVGKSALGTGGIAWATTNPGLTQKLNERTENVYENKGQGQEVR
jgi:hypothetical protein